MEILFLFISARTFFSLSLFCGVEIETNDGGEGEGEGEGGGDFLL